MDKKKVLQIVGYGLSALGLVLGLATNVVSEKVNNLEMKETIAKEVAKQLNSNKES